MNDMRDGIVSIRITSETATMGRDQQVPFSSNLLSNNLTVPALFFEAQLVTTVRAIRVVDGQQRLTTLRAYYEGEFALVGSNDAPYLSPNSIHYAAKVRPICHGIQTGV